MAYDAKMSSDPQVLLQDGFHIGFCLENLSKVFHSKNMKITDQTEENTHQEEN